MDFGWGHEGAGRDNTRLYHILGINPTVSCDEIPEIATQLASQNLNKPAYLREIRNAAQVLANSEYRQFYDVYGEAGLERLPIPPESPADAHYELEVTMQEVYQGTEKTIEGTRSRLCPGCSGQGATDYMVCKMCAGRKLVHQQSFHGYRTVPCKHCGGTGKLPNPLFSCTQCMGRKAITESVPLRLILKPGFPDQAIYNFPGQGNQQPGRPVEDYNVKVRYILPENISVKEADVVYRRQITLGELLGGYRFHYKNFDGSDHWISSSAGEIGHPPGFRMVKGLGLPKYNHSGAFGDLIIAFAVRYPSPEQLTSFAVTTVKELLPSPPMLYAGHFPAGQRHVPVPFVEGHVTKEEGRQTYSDHKDEEERDEDEDGFVQHAHCSGVLF